MKLKKDDLAVVEIVGSVLLLSMAVAAFSVIYMNVLSDDGPDPETFTTIIGSMANENGDNYPDIVFQHTRGETLGPDTELVLDIVNDFNKSGEDIVYITIAGRSNGLSGVVAATAATSSR